MQLKYEETMADHRSNRKQTYAVSCLNRNTNPPEIFNVRNLLKIILHQELWDWWNSFVYHLTFCKLYCSTTLSSVNFPVDLKVSKFPLTNLDTTIYFQTIDQYLFLTNWSKILENYMLNTFHSFQQSTQSKRSTLSRFTWTVCISCSLLLIFLSAGMVYSKTKR